MFLCVCFISTVLFSFYLSTTADNPQFKGTKMSYFLLLFPLFRSLNTRTLAVYIAVIVVFFRQNILSKSNRNRFNSKRSSYLCEDILVWSFRISIVFIQDIIIHRNFVLVQIIPKIARALSHALCCTVSQMAPHSWNLELQYAAILRRFWAAILEQEAI